MTVEQKRQHWQAHINRWQNTELTQNAYCLEHNLAKSSFSYWRKRLSDAATDQPSSKFIPLKMAVAELVTLSVAGVRIELPTSALEQVLPVVLCAAREAR